MPLEQPSANAMVSEPLSVAAQTRSLPVTGTGPVADKDSVTPKSQREYFFLFRFSINTVINKVIIIPCFTGPVQNRTRHTRSSSTVQSEAKLPDMDQTTASIQDEAVGITSTETLADGKFQLIW